LRVIILVISICLDAERLDSRLDNRSRLRRLDGFLDGSGCRGIGPITGLGLRQRLGWNRDDGFWTSHGTGWGDIFSMPLRLSGGFCRGIQGGERRDECGLICRGTRDRLLRSRGLSQGLILIGSFRRWGSRTPRRHASSDRRTLVPGPDARE
jgi:hypothetical protein